MKRLFVLLSTAFLLFGAQEAMAQSRTVTGRVTAAATGQPLPGITVTVKGSTLGTQTNAEGRYSLNVPANATTLVFSSIAYGLKEMPITGATVDVALTPQALALQGVVVTAMGVEQKKSQLGTAQQTITAEDLTQTHTQSLVNDLQGKVSGVQITGSGTQGGSQKITIRGANSLLGSNNPLFVVDGIPISNTGRGGDPDGGYDYGSAINDLNPQDIASVTVLKGPNAAALYGSRATNGAILITTKKARSGQIRTEASMTYTWDTPSILPEYQNQYGQGAGGEFNFVNGAGASGTDGLDQSWGPKLDGRLICQFNSPRDANGVCQPTPWVAHPNNVKSFFDTGHSLSTTVAVSGGTDRASARLSLGMDNTKGYIPNNTFQKFSSLLTGNVDVTDRFKVNGTLQYLRNKGMNRPGTGYNVGILEQFIWFGRQVDMDALRDYQENAGDFGGPEGAPRNWNYNFHNNPFWLQNENPQSDTRDRVMGVLNLSYQLTDWLRATAQTGSDIYNYAISRHYAQGNINYANPAFAGGFLDLADYSNENTSKVQLQADHGLGSHLQLNALLGGSQHRNQWRSSSVSTSGISAPGIYNVSNAAIAPSNSQSIERSQMNSLFGSASLTWNGWWTVEGTGRNDWSSTLPDGNNSYFYPSVSTSMVLTDAIPALRNNVLSYLKIRGSIAKVGSDADPYSLRATYSGISDKFAGLPQFTLANALANEELKPEITKASEVGLEVEFFNGRAALDATYYTKATTNQIFPISLSPTTGFSSRYINAGKMENHGVEALLSVTPVQLRDFQWTSTFNYSRNRNKVVALTEGIDALSLGNSWYTTIQARVGHPYGVIYGNAFARDEATGKPLTTSKGYWVANSTPQILGNIEPDWTGGWSNDFRYKNVSLSALLDIRSGGDIVSVTNFFSDYAGITKASLKGRENDWDDGIVIDGINQKTGEPNTVEITAEEYWQTIFPIMEPYVYDGGWVKLREVRLGFDLPQKWASMVSANHMSIALTGRNLWAHTHVPNIDPEFSYTIGNFQGIEFAALPNTRSIGLSVNVTP